MRFRTKIFLGWAALTLCLLTGTFFAMRRSVETSFARMSEETFAGINRGHAASLSRAGQQHAAGLRPDGEYPRPAGPDRRTKL